MAEARGLSVNPKIAVVGLTFNLEFVHSTCLSRLGEDEDQRWGRDTCASRPHDCR